MSPLYWRFISDYFYCLIPLITVWLVRLGWWRITVRRVIISIRSWKEKILEYFNAYFLYDLYYRADTRKELQLVDSFRITDRLQADITAEATSMTENPGVLRRSKNLRRRNRLKPGSEAPYFYLKKIPQGFSYIVRLPGRIDLPAFLGYLVDHALGIPSLNKLAENLSGKPIEIINICLDDEYEKWETIIIEK